MERRSFLTQTMGGAVTAMAAPLAWSRGHSDQAAVRYPDSAIETLDSRFEKYRQNNAAVERLLGLGTDLGAGDERSAPRASSS